VRRLPAAVAVALALGAVVPAPAGSLDGPAPAEQPKDKETQKRAGKKPASPAPSPKPARVFTDDDLKKYSEERAASGEDASATGSTEPAGAEGSTSSGDADADRRQQWQRRAREARENVAEAEALVTALEQKITDLRVDRGADNAMDPFRLQTLQAEIQKATAELTAARDQAQSRRAALDAVLEDARRQGIPPGWVREP
jgi:hypothetical protein